MIVSVLRGCKNASQSLPAYNNSIEKIQPRMMVSSFNGNPSIMIISCYSPTKVSDETDLITFYNELVCCIPKYNVLIMNAQIGKNENNKFSFHK